MVAQAGSQENPGYRGWSGWYKGWYFRSLHELSYMINIIERFKFNWKSAERKELKIVQLKKEAAINFCKNKNLIYKLTCPSKLLSLEDIELLINTNKLEFISRYKEKYKQLKINLI
jgi:hypothetical protein